MKMLTAIFSLFLIGATLSFAQVNSKYDGPKPEVYAGAKSLVFMYTPFQSNLDQVPVGRASFGTEDPPFSGNVDFDVQTLYGVGFQYYVSNEIALVLGLNFGTGSYEITENLSTTITELTEQSNTSFGLSVDANYHLKALYGISTYFGINVNFSSLSGTRDITTNGATPAVPVATYELSGTGFGAGLNFGFDWYFTEGLSLGGKYTLGFSSLGAPDYTRQIGGVSTTVEGPSSSSLGTGSASVMLNVHF
jgi:hypothetical protein